MTKIPQCDSISRIMKTSIVNVVIVIKFFDLVR